MAAGATYEPIATTTLGSANNTISFTSIPNTYTDLRVALVGTSGTSNANQLALQFNSDTGTNYSTTYLYGNGTTANSGRETSQVQIVLEPGFGTLSTTIPWFFQFDVFSYAGSTYKTVLSNGNTDANGSGIVYSNVGLWRSTAAITTLTLKRLSTATFASGTTATLYGIKSA